MNTAATLSRNANIPRKLTEKQEAARECIRLKMHMQYAFGAMMRDPSEENTAKYQRSERLYWNSIDMRKLV